jgi:chromosome segregation ATPase
VSVEGKEEGSVLAPEDPVAALRELQLEHTRRVQGLRATIASNGIALNELQLKLSDETKARVSVEEELKDLRTSLEQSEVVVRQLKERVDVQKEQFEQELASQAQGYENRLVGMERDSAQVLREECADMEAELSDNKARVRELEAETIALQSQLESKAAERAANEDKERYYRKAADEALEESEEQYRLELEAVQAKHSAAMAEAERRLAEATSSMTSAQAEMDAQAKQERYLKFEALREEAKHAVAMAEERMRDEHNSILSRLISRHAFETEALHTELQDSRQALTGAAQEYETMAAYLADLEGAFESRLAEELGALREEATELRAVQLEQAVVVAELEKTIDRLVGENRDAEGQREAALEQHSRAQDRMQQSLRSLAAEMTALQESNAAYASSLRAMERELDEERAAARAVKLRLEASLHKAQADSEAYVRDVLRTNEEELRTMVQEKIGGFSRISELEGRLETLTTELSAKAEAELARVREQHASELQAAEARRREAMSRLEAEADAREEELQSRHRRAVRDMRQACDADMAAAEEWAEKRAQQRMAELTARMR